MSERSVFSPFCGRLARPRLSVRRCHRVNHLDLSVFIVGFPLEMHPDAFGDAPGGKILGSHPEMMRFLPSSSKAWSRQASAASVASPCFQL